MGRLVRPTDEHEADCQRAETSQDVGKGSQIEWIAFKKATEAFRCAEQVGEDHGAHENRRNQGHDVGFPFPVLEQVNRDDPKCAHGHQLVDESEVTPQDAELAGKDGQKQQGDDKEGQGEVNPVAELLLVEIQHFGHHEPGRTHGCISRSDRTGHHADDGQDGSEPA